MGIESAACEFASRGFKVVACYGMVAGKCSCGGRQNCKPGKHPIPPHGANDATTDAETIKRWYFDHPWANVGLIVGPESGLWIVECDPRNGGDATVAAWAEEHGPMTTTPTVRSGGGGTHWYFRYPAGVVLKSAPIATGVDSKSSGLVIVPPSLHESGRRYEWVHGFDTPIADAPDWLIALAVDGDAARTPFGGDGGASGGWTMTMGGDGNDFASHPGAKRGTRNDTICRLIGVHLARGDSPRTIEALALAWASRCDPPIPEKDIRRHLAHAERRWRKAEVVDSGWGVGVIDSAPDVWSEGTKVVSPPTDLRPSVLTTVTTNAETQRSEVEPPTPHHLSTPHEDGWPTLHADALHGIVGDIVRAIEPETEADPAGVLVSLLIHVGNAIGRGPHVVVGAIRHHANEFGALVGDTAAGKGIAESVAEYAMKQADPDHGETIGHGLSSGEGLIDRVRDDDDTTTDVFATPTTKRLLALETEFVRPITAGRREGNTLSAVLRSAWDGDVLETITRTPRTKGKPPSTPLRASNAHVSVIGHITPTELTAALGKAGGVDLANGFANRFLWTVVRRSRLLPHGGDVTVLDSFVRPLADALANARVRGRLRRSPDADRLWEGVYGDLTEARPGTWGLVVGRARAHVVRLSLIYALLDNANDIEVVHLKAALAVWRYCEHSARLIFGGGNVDRVVGGGVASTPTTLPPNALPQPLTLRLLDAIAKAPGTTRRELGRSFRSETAEAITTALTQLESQRLAHHRQCPSGGRPAECWFPGTPDGHDDTTIDTTEGDDAWTFTMGGEADSPPMPMPLASPASDGGGGRKDGDAPVVSPVGTKSAVDGGDLVPSLVPTTTTDTLCDFGDGGDLRPYDLTTITTGGGNAEDDTPTPTHLSPTSVAIDADDFLNDLADTTTIDAYVGDIPDAERWWYYGALSDAGFVPGTPMAYLDAELMATVERCKAMAWARARESEAMASYLKGEVNDIGGDILDLNVKRYLDALSLKGIEPGTPVGTLSPKQRAEVEACKRYALAQAKEDARLRRLRQDDYSADEWAAVFWAEVGPLGGDDDTDRPPTCRLTLDGRGVEPMG